MAATSRAPALRVGAAAGVTLMELLVVLAVLAILAAITVPGLGDGGGHVAALRAAQRLATALRLAQACAQDGERRMRVVLEGASTFSVERRCADGWARESRTSIGAVECSTNFPGGAVELDGAGLPLATTTGAPRAGTFTLARGAAQRAVVVQLTGRVRVR
jgi:prepilin-type N-terminal cleavage/methylation domain-containing protein